MNYEPCDPTRKDDCEAACCYYPRKVISAKEAASLDKDKVIFDGAEWRFRNDPTTGGCIYLDTKNQCSIYEKRPALCRDYSCRYDIQIDAHIKRLQTRDLSLAKRAVKELRRQAADMFKTPEEQEAYLDLLLQ